MWSWRDDWPFVAVLLVLGMAVALADSPAGSWPFP